MWSRAEEERLKTLAGLFPLREVAESFPGRSRNAVGCKINRMGLKPYGNGRRWTKREDARLLSMGAALFAKNYDRTLAACYQRHQALAQLQSLSSSR